jgi:hypothetical protein
MSKPGISVNQPKEYFYFIPLVMGLCRESARHAGWTNERWIKFHDEAMAADDDRFLEVVSREFDVAGKATP